MSSRDRVCTIYVAKKDMGVFPGIQGWRQELEKCQNKDSIRRKVLDEMLIWMGQGETEQISKLLMSVIRFILPSEDNQIKKRLQIFWENCIFTNEDGSLKSEMILVCDTIRRDLQSPNEFIRGSTCRMLCNINQLKLLEPLMDAIRANLSNRHPYVVRNAIMCVYSILRLDINAIPGVLDEVESLLHSSSTDDPSTVRNAFLVLLELEPVRAIRYAQDVQSVICDMGDLFHMQYLNLLKKLCESEPEKVTDYLTIVANLIEIATNPAVLYEGAMTVLSFSNARGTCKIAVKVLLGLLESHSDVNVRQVIMNRLYEVVDDDPLVFESLLLDVLRVLGSASNSIRPLLATIIMKINSIGNYEAILGFTRKELIKIHEAERLLEDGARYLGLLLMINASIYRKFHSALEPDAVLLSSLFSDPKYGQHLDDLRVAKNLSERSDGYTCSIQKNIVVIFRDVIMSSKENNGEHYLNQHIVDLLEHCRSSSVLRTVLWIITHHLPNDPTLAEKIITTIYNLLTPFPLAEKSTNSDENTATITEGKINWIVRECIIKADDQLLSSLICAVMARFASVVAKYGTDSEMIELATKVIANIYILMRNHSLIADKSPSLYRINCALQCAMKAKKGDLTSVDKLLNLLLPYKETDQMGFERNQIDTTIGQGNRLSSKKKRSDTSNTVCKPLVFRHLSTPSTTIIPKKMDDITDLELALYGTAQDEEDSERFLAKLEGVSQMTGLGDPIYIEAFFSLDGFDITGEFLVINRTAETIEDFCLEISSGCESMNFVSLPQPVTIAAHGSATLIVSLKVKNTDTGLVFGYATYSSGQGGGSTKKSLPLHDVHVDLLKGNNNICTIDDATFRELWTLFEWENKIPVKTISDDIRQFMTELSKSTNMVMLDSNILDIVTDNDLPFISQNLYCKTAFDEEALANVSLFSDPQGKLLDGHIRIRARKQGIALTIGDRVSAIQKVS